MFFDFLPLAPIRRGTTCALAVASTRESTMELDYLLALKLFLAVAPLLGLLALETTLWLRDKRRMAKALPLLPGRFARTAEVRVRTK